MHKKCTHQLKAEHQLILQAWECYDSAIYVRSKVYGSGTAGSCAAAIPSFYRGW